MKALFFLSFILIGSALFALGRQDDSGRRSLLMTQQNREAEKEAGAMELPEEAAQYEVVRAPGEARIVTGGIEEVDLLSYDPEPGLLEFIYQCVFEKTADQSESDAGSSVIEFVELGNCSIYSERIGDSSATEVIRISEVIRLFRQIVRGVKYITCLKLPDGDLAVFIIHKDISGEFSLVESYRDTEIFEYFGSFL